MAATGRYYPLGSQKYLMADRSNEPDRSRIQGAAGFDRIHIFTDGAARGNPGPACYAFIVTAGDRIILERAGYIGEATNNIAEYQAVIHALTEARALTAGTVVVSSDSELVVRQITGVYRVRQPHLARLHSEVVRLIGHFDRVTFSSVPRTERHIQAADALCNRCLDERRQRGERR